MSELGDNELANINMPLSFIGLVFIGVTSRSEETDGTHLWASEFTRSLIGLCLLV